MIWWVYLVWCADQSIYCGITNDLEKRTHWHNEGKGAKYTRSRRPVQLVWYTAFPTKELALKREAEIKRLTRKQKLELIANV